MEYDEKEAVAQAQANPQAFAQLYDRYVDRIYAFACRQTQDRTLAQDVTAATFEKALRHIRQFEWRGTTFAAWLYRIARNEAMSLHRRQKWLAPWQHPYSAPARQPETAVQQQEAQHALHQTLAQLSYNDREILALRFFEELSGEEVAEVLGCSVNTAYVRLHRALKRLQELMAPSAQQNEVNYVPK